MYWSVRSGMVGPWAQAGAVAIQATAARANVVVARSRIRDLTPKALTQSKTRALWWNAKKARKGAVSGRIPAPDGPTLVDRAPKSVGPGRAVGASSPRGTIRGLRDFREA